MDTLGRLLVRRIYQAESRTALVVEPIGQEFDAILILYFKILPMCFDNVRGGFPTEIVAIHKDSHHFLLNFDLCDKFMPVRVFQQSLKGLTNPAHAQRRLFDLRQSGRG